jgi:hypothetical protein
VRQVGNLDWDRQAFNPVPRTSATVKLNWRFFFEQKGAKNAKK